MSLKFANAVGLLALHGLILPIAKADAHALEWELEVEPGAFVAQVARACLSSPDSRVEILPRGLRVVDRPTCAQEIKSMSLKWASNPARDFVAVHTGTIDRARELSERLKSGPGMLAFKQASVIGWGDHCPCLVFGGAQSHEAARLAYAELSPGSGKIKTDSH